MPAMTTTTPIRVLSVFDPTPDLTTCLPRHLLAKSVRLELAARPRVPWRPHRWPSSLSCTPTRWTSHISTSIEVLQRPVELAYDGAIGVMVAETRKVLDERGHLTTKPVERSHVPVKDRIRSMRSLGSVKTG